MRKHAYEPLNVEKLNSLFRPQGADALQAAMATALPLCVSLDFARHRDAATLLEAALLEHGDGPVQVPEAAALLATLALERGKPFVAHVVLALALEMEAEGQRIHEA